MYSNIINPADVLGSCNSAYTLLKVSENFPNYKAYSDIDILYAIDSNIVQECRSYIDAVYGIHNETHIMDSGARVHVDLFPVPGERLDIKFDFINSFSVYSKCFVSDDFVHEVLDNRVFCNNNKCYTPDPYHEMIIRVLEYLEYVDSRPSKVKHLDYVKEKITMMDRGVFFNSWNKFVGSTTDISLLLGED